MNRSILQQLRYLFAPEESSGHTVRIIVPGSAGMKRITRVSGKCVFWAAVAVTIGLLIGRLS